MQAASTSALLLQQQLTTLCKTPLWGFIVGPTVELQLPLQHPWLMTQYTRPTIKLLFCSTCHMLNIRSAGDTKQRLQQLPTTAGCGEQMHDVDVQPPSFLHQLPNQISLLFRQLKVHSKPSHCTPYHTRLVSLDLCLATPVLLPLLHFAVLSPAGQAACGVVLGHHAAMLQERNLWRLKHSLAYC